MPVSKVEFWNNASIQSGILEYAQISKYATLGIMPKLEKIVIKRTREVNLEGLKLLKKEGINIQEY